MSQESQWVTFRTGGETFGFEIEYVKEMLRLPHVYPIPNAPPDNLGVILLRSEVIPVFDLRRRFGMVSCSDRTEELVELLQARQQDHENWLVELERSVVEKRPFTLTTDPHQCKFGKWYDSFATTDHVLASLMQRFDDPHQRIHAVGKEVIKLQENQTHDRALELIHRSRQTVFRELIQLFTDTIRECARQSLIVVGTAACTLGIAVDDIHAVIRCRDEEIQSPDSIPGVDQFGGLIGLVPEKTSQKFILLIDPAQLYPQLIPTASRAPAPE